MAIVNPRQVRDFARQRKYAQVTSPNGRWMTFQHDSSNRITQVTDNIGRIVKYTHDSGGRLQTVTDPKQWRHPLHL